MAPMFAAFLSAACVAVAVGVVKYDEPHFAAMTVPPLLLSAVILALLAARLV